MQYQSYGTSRTRRFLGAVCPLIIVLIGTPAASGQLPPGSLDPTFSVDGKTTTGISANTDPGTGMALQADGKIVVVGTSTNGDFAVSRHKTNGFLDTTFGIGGQVLTDFGGNDRAFAVAIQMDGKIVVVGSTEGSSLALARYNTNGTLDTSFDSDGRVTAANAYMHSIAIQPDGKIVTAGSTFNISTNLFEFCLRRYTSDGVSDVSFDGDGVVATDIGSDNDQAYAVVIQSDGKLVVAGFAKLDELDYDFALARYNTNGSLDTSLDFDGKVTTSFSTNQDTASAIALQSDGKLIAAGSICPIIYCTGFALARYNSDGSLDATFGDDGKVMVETGGLSAAHAVAIQTDGKIVAAGASLGSSPEFGSPDFALARFNANGSLDMSFHNDGIVRTDFRGADDAAHAVALQQDGKIVAAGYNRNGDYSKSFFALTRYTANGQPDVYTFGLLLVGKVSTAFHPTNDSALAVAVQTDAKIVTAGYAGDRVALVRYERDGTRDATFGVDGRVTTSIGPGSLQRASALAIQPDGKIVAAGYSDSGGFPSKKFAVFRYNPDGSLDSSFGTGGIVTTLVGPFESFAQAVSIQGDGKIVVAGSARNFDKDFDFAVVRYSSNGSLDQTFNGNGIATTNITGSDFGSGLVIQPDGKLVAAGFSETAGQVRYFALARYNANGSPDTSFGLPNMGGTVITDFVIGQSSASSVALQRDGRIVAGGWVRNADMDLDFALARYNNDGSLDTSFDGDGRVTISGFQYDDESVASVAVQSNGRIVAAGYVFGLYASFTIARFDPNGSLDNTFGSNGKAYASFGEYSLGQAAIIEPNGKIVVAGVDDTCSGGPSCTDFAIARFVGDVRSNFDYDGDGRSDMSVFRPSDRNWYLLRSRDGFTGVNFGLTTDKIAPADFDRDGRTDVAVYRPEAGAWYWLNSSNGAFNSIQFGTAEDLPLPGDYDGDGKADLTVFRPSQGTWYRQNSSNGTFFGFQFGANGDVPTVGDFDGDGKNDLGIWRPSNGDWYNIRSSNGSVFGERFGQSGDKIAPADYDGDGNTDIAIWRPSTGLWVVRNSATATYSYSVFGAMNDVPVAGDYDGDGKADIGVWRPADGTWYVQRSSNGSFLVFPWGQNGDRPTPSAYGN
jgi:uncharacterized delta-60 repeat protein